MEYGVSKHGGIWIRTTMRDNIGAHTVYVSVNDNFVAAFVVSPMPKQVTLKILGYIAVNEFPFAWEVRGLKTYKGDYGRRPYKRRSKTLIKEGE